MASGSMYSHRGLQPPAPQSASGHGSSHHRIPEVLDVIKQEYEQLLADLTITRKQRDEYESKMSSQVNELHIIRQSLYELESQHTKVQTQYEEDLSRLRGELHSLRANAANAGPPTHAMIGPGSSSLSGSLPPSHGPYQGEALYGRDRDRDRDRDMRDRIDRDVRLSDRERDLRERERERDRDRDRLLDQREAKRFKPDRMKSDRPDHFSPHLASVPKVPLPAMPPISGSGSASVVSPHTQLPPLPLTAPTTATAAAAAAGPMPISNDPFPDDLNPANLPPEFKKEGNDWFVAFNPKLKRSLDVSLVHTLMHATVVCCVQFSADGKYLATGCNRTAQIYDVRTGQKTCTLSDDNVPQSGDLYIRSVRFSPDGKYLATGAEDKQIRIWDIAKRRIRNVFDGHQQEIYSLDFSADGRLIVSGSGDRTARIWDMNGGPGKVLQVKDPDVANEDAGVTSVCISPDGRFVAAGSLDTIVRIWDVTTGQLVDRLIGHLDSVYSVVFTPDGKGLISGSLDKTLKYWDMQPLMRGHSGDDHATAAMNFTGHKDYVLSVAVSYDGQWVVSGSKDRGVLFWDAKTASMLCMLQGHKNSVISIDLSPTSNMLATGSGDNLARIWAYDTM